jgi:hypothetical protein
MRASLLLIIAAAIVLGLSLQSPLRGQEQGQGQEDAASKQGRALLERMCLSSCHTLKDFDGLAHDREQWKTIVDDMMTKGATGTDREVVTLVDYLVLKYGPKADAAHQ